MKKTTLFAGAALSILLPAAAAAQTRDPGPDEHLLINVSDVEWRDGPASTEARPRGSEG